LEDQLQGRIKILEESLDATKLELESVKTTLKEERQQKDTLNVQLKQLRVDNEKLQLQLNEEQEAKKLATLEEKKT